MLIKLKYDAFNVNVELNCKNNYRNGKRIYRGNANRIRELTNRTI